MDPKARETIICIADTPLKKFKQFDIIADKHPNHGRYLSPSVISNHSQTQLCSETISLMKEWNILRNNLPDSIFVRAYEGTIDLLRAVIIGPPGTPYQNGLFFYDIQITSGYPYTRPDFRLTFPAGPDTTDMACYRAKPCRRLKTKNKKKYSILEILLLQQKNLITSKPKPALHRPNGILPTYCDYLLEKDYSSFYISCQIMLAILREPSKHFEEFTAKHFRDHAESILVTCKSYIDDVECNDIVQIVADSATVATKQERKRFKKKVKSVYYRLFEAFMKNGSPDSLENIYNIGDISKDDIDVFWPCSSYFLIVFAYGLVCVFMALGVGFTDGRPPDINHEGMLIICLGITIVSGLAFVLLKLCDCYFRIDDITYDYWVQLP